MGGVISAAPVSAGVRCKEHADPVSYNSRFTNRYGEQWIFEYDDSSGQGILSGSDVDWQQYRVIDGKAHGLILNDEEIEWLHNAWSEALSASRRNN